MRGHYDFSKGVRGKVAKHVLQRAKAAVMLSKTTVVCEKDFWIAMEYRLCHEFDKADSMVSGLGGIWCDGFIPESYRISDEVPLIGGRAWICFGPDQYEWTF